ncbi:hypothetical protein D9M72_549480 [compost metagenome]
MTISKIVSDSAADLLCRSATEPSTTAPTGRMMKPTPKVATPNSRDTELSSDGKKSFEMVSAKKPYTAKSYHSSAHPTTAAAIAFF